MEKSEVAVMLHQQFFNRCAESKYTILALRKKNKREEKKILHADHVINSKYEAVIRR